MAEMLKVSLDSDDNKVKKKPLIVTLVYHFVFRMFHFVVFSIFVTPMISYFSHFIGQPLIPSLKQKKTNSQHNFSSDKSQKSNQDPSVDAYVTENSFIRLAVLLRLHSTTKPNNCCMTVLNISWKKIFCILIEILLHLVTKGPMPTGGEPSPEPTYY